MGVDAQDCRLGGALNEGGGLQEGVVATETDTEILISCIIVRQIYF